MNDERNPVPFWLIALFTILVLGLLTVIFWDFVTRNVILPIYSFFILAVYGINSVQQSIYLFLLILLGIIAAVIFLGTTFSKSRPSEYGSFAQYSIEIESRYAFWQMQCANLNRNAFSNEEFARQTRRLLLEVLAYQEHRDPFEIEKLVMQEQLDLPPEVQYLIAHRKLATAVKPRNWFQRQWRKLLRRLNRDTRTPSCSLMEEVEVIINFLEQRLEISHND